MSSSIRWIVVDHLMLATLEGEVSLEDVIHINNWSRDKMKTSPAPHVHMVLDNRATAKYHFTLMEAKSALQLGQRPHNSGYVVLVQNKSNTFTSALNFMNSVAAQLAGVHFRLENSIEDALAFLYSIDLSLSNSLQLTPNPLQTD